MQKKGNDISQFHSGSETKSKISYVSKHFCEQKLSVSYLS